MRRPPLGSTTPRWFGVLRGQGLAHRGGRFGKPSQGGAYTWTSDPPVNVVSMDPLDELDPRRFDADEITERLNAFYELSDAEQEAALNEWKYSGMADA